jgi:hypothetical protein
MHGIALRQRGGVSHVSRVRPNADLPPLLRKCTAGQFGRQRVERFLVIESCRSLGEAAELLGVHQPTLTSQLVRLEGDAGGPLLVRARHGFVGQKATTLGRRLVREAEKYLGPSSSAPRPPGVARAGASGRARPSTPHSQPPTRQPIDQVK